VAALGTDAAAAAALLHLRYTINSAQDQAHTVLTVVAVCQHRPPCQQATRQLCSSPSNQCRVCLCVCTLHKCIVCLQHNTTCLILNRNNNISRSLHCTAIIRRLLSSSVCVCVCDVKDETIGDIRYCPCAMHHSRDRAITALLASDQLLLHAATVFDLRARFRTVSGDTHTNRIYLERSSWSHSRLTTE
jgi:hypothetical protein